MFVFRNDTFELNFDMNDMTVFGKINPVQHFFTFKMSKTVDIAF